MFTQWARPSPIANIELHIPLCMQKTQINGKPFLLHAGSFAFHHFNHPVGLNICGKSRAFVPEPCALIIWGQSKHQTLYNAVLDWAFSMDAIESQCIIYWVTHMSTNKHHVQSNAIHSPQYSRICAKRPQICGKSRVFHPESCALIIWGQNKHQTLYNAVLESIQSMNVIESQI